MTQLEYETLQQWLSNFKANKRKANRMFAFSGRDSEMVNTVIIV